MMTTTNSSIQKRYNRARNHLRRNFYKLKDQNIQEEIAWTINKIETYGFNFYPETYVEDEVVKLENLVDQYLNNKEKV